MQDTAHILARRGECKFLIHSSASRYGYRKSILGIVRRRSPRSASSFGSYGYCVRQGKPRLLSRIHNHTPYIMCLLWLFSESGRNAIAIAGVVVVRVPVGVHIAKVRRVGRIRRTQPPIRGNIYQDATYIQSIHSCFDSVILFTLRFLFIFVIL